MLIRPLVILSQTLASGTVDHEYRVGLTAVGGKSPYVWSLLSGLLPPGLSIGADGVIAGVSTEYGVWPFIALVTRERRCSGVDVCRVQPSECRVLAIPNGPTQLGEKVPNVISTCGYPLSTPDAQNSAV